MDRLLDGVRTEVAQSDDLDLGAQGLGEPFPAFKSQPIWPFSPRRCAL